VHLSWSAIVPQEAYEPGILDSHWTLRGHWDGRALGGILLGFGLVEADDIAAVPGFAVGTLARADDLLDQQIGGATPSRFGDAKRHIRGRIGDDAADLLGGAFAHADNLVDVAVLHIGQCGLADPAAIRDNADAGDQESLSEAVDYRQKGSHIGGVARPQLGADRPAVGVDHHCQYHLLEVGSVKLPSKLRIIIQPALWRP
jgi:hypothetical protein